MPEGSKHKQVGNHVWRPWGEEGPSWRIMLFFSPLGYYLQANYIARDPQENNNWRVKYSYETPIFTELPHPDDRRRKYVAAWPNFEWRPCVAMRRWFEDTALPYEELTQRGLEMLRTDSFFRLR